MLLALAAFLAVLEISLRDYAILVPVGALHQVGETLSGLFLGDAEAAGFIGALEHVDDPVLVDGQPQRTEIVQRERAAGIRVCQGKQFGAPSVEIFPRHGTAAIGVKQRKLGKAAVIAAVIAA